MSNETLGSSAGDGAGTSRASGTGTGVCSFGKGGVRLLARRVASLEAGRRCGTLRSFDLRLASGPGCICTQGGDKRCRGCAHTHIHGSCSTVSSQGGRSASAAQGVPPRWDCLQYRRGDAVGRAWCVASTLSAHLQDLYSKIDTLLQVVP